MRIKGFKGYNKTKQLPTFDENILNNTLKLDCTPS